MLRSATAGGLDKSFSTLSTPALDTPAPGQVALSYWAVRSSVDTTVAAGADVTVCSTAVGTGGGRIVSVAAASDGATSTGRTAAVSPAAAHGIAWTLVLSASS